MASGYTANNADAYERLMGRWSRSLAGEFVAFAGLTPGDRVLDLGCGTGSLVRALAARSEPSIILGTDIAPLFLRHAAASVIDPRIVWAVADGGTLPLPDANVDRALSQLVLNFIPTPDRAISELVRVTRPGGMIAASVWDFTGGLVYQRMFWDTAAALDPVADRARGRQCSLPLTGPGELAAAFVVAGLTDVESHAITIRMEYADFADYWRPIAEATGPVGDYIRATDPALLAHIEERLRAAYLSGRTDGPRSLAGTAWVAKGRRQTK
jgi:SAM-dependent methyltransferase